MAALYHHRARETTLGECLENAVEVHFALAKLQHHIATQSRAIRKAVRQERQRVKERPAPEPATEIGKKIKQMSNAPTTLVDKIVRKGATAQLREFKSKSKPH